MCQSPSLLLTTEAQIKCSPYLFNKLQHSAGALKGLEKTGKAT